VSAKVFFLNQTQLAKLLQMVMRHAGTAEMQGMLNFADALGIAAFEEEPVDFPRFASQGVFNVVLLVRVQLDGT
jgi:hypothetical protein